MDNRSNPKKSNQTNTPFVQQSVAPVAPIRMKPSTMNWLMSRGFATMAPRVPRPLPLRPSTPRPPGPRSLGSRTLGQRPLGPRPLESRPPGSRTLGSRPLGPLSMELQTFGPRALGSRALGPLLPIAPPNMDMFIGEMHNPLLYGYIPALIDEQRFRRRRQSHARTINPTVTSSGINSHALLANVNDERAAQKIVSITYVDPTGGSMIVTRRREDGQLDVRTVYSREFIVAASASPLALLPPANFRQMVLEMMEIIAKFPKSYYNTISENTATTSSN